MLFDCFAAHEPWLQYWPATQPASVVHAVGQLARVPSQTKGAQDGFAPPEPDARTEHVPTLPVTSQRSQPPVHALLQQTLSAQNPDAHWVPNPHAAPSTCAALQTPWLQYCPVTQSVSAAQLVAQVALDPEHTYGAHEGEPALPLLLIAHVPSTLAPAATEHASQAPEQAVLQQTPSTQDPDWHWLRAEHFAPSAARVTHWPATVSQYRLEAHWASVRQVAGHETDDPSHANGAQLGDPAPTTDMQAPSLKAPCATEHASQAPLQAELQHTPSAQDPDWHWLFVVQALASGARGRHVWLVASQ